ncbi:FAD-dependent monooxygenase, partial [Pelagibacterales bacterium SAG-MED20]|nr:FAD-dependent monooxygenase [Pelagibacterales bacterium SAG-MED20]
RKNPEYEITIFERSNSVNLEKGYGIQLSVNSIRLLNEIGFQNIALKEKFHPNKVDFYSLQSKKKISDLDISIFNDSENKYTTLQRSTLINFLKDRLPSNLINYNKKVISINHKTESIEIFFEDKSKIECDYLIISDGVFSKTKSLIAEREIKPKYFNSIVLRATINQNELQKVDPNNISLFLGSNLHSVVYPVDKNGLFNFVSILRKSLNDTELSNYSLFHSSNFISSVLTEISKQVDPNIVKILKNIKIFPIFVSSEIYQPINKNIFLIGDAFFTFPPTFAQGASQSIEVAHELYKNFGNELNQFNIKRIKRTKMIDKKSKFNYFAFHLNNPLLSFLRNFLIKYLVKNERFINSYLGKIYKD